MSDVLTIQSHKGPYKAHFDVGALKSLNDNIAPNTHFIIDVHVAELYQSQMSNVLASPSVLLIKADENNKSLDKFPAYVEHLVSNGLRRDHTLVAIGGGIIQDITCFLSATMLRGVKWEFYPTTLLSQADSCIGSKSSINSGAAKNILGTFTPPHRINIATPFLDTLDRRDVLSGVGEMLKVHIIDGPASFDQIATDYQRMLSEPEVMQSYIRRSLEIKKRYIEKDEFDQTIRNVFNYGHSFGHAIEAATNFAIPHGIAVTIGMDMANHIAAKLGVGSEQNAARMHPTLHANYQQFEKFPIPIEPLISALSKDKKNVGSGTVTLILVDKKGAVFKDSYPNNSEFATLCEEFLQTGRQL